MTLEGIAKVSAIYMMTAILIAMGQLAYDRLAQSTQNPVTIEAGL
ncbi:hypothetical protein ACSV9I_02670 [Rhizobium sp. G187]|nr:hypothetical protein [Rhizobium sp. AAP43]